MCNCYFDTSRDYYFPERIETFFRKGQKMRGLKICLWVGGILCIICVLGVFLPMATLESLAKFFGAETPDFSDSPVFEYIVRVMLATYACIGVFLIILATNPAKYRAMVTFTGVASILLGIVCAITGLVVEMPVEWFLGDCLPCIVFGILVLIFQQKAKQPCGESTETM